MTAPFVETPFVEISADAAPTAGQRIARTGGQAGAAGFVVVLAAWVLRLLGVDLDPGAGVEMPTEVTVALSGLLTTLAAWAMNRPEKVEQVPQAVTVAAVAGEQAKAAKK